MMIKQDDRVVCNVELRKNGKVIFHEGEVCRVLHISYNNTSLWLESIATGVRDTLATSDVREATVEEEQEAVKIYKQLAIWKSIHRAYKFFKEGDIVALDQGTIGVITKIDGDTIRCLWGTEASDEIAADLILVAPVNARLDTSL
ncbi:hypothetical protein D3C78_20160 [compost metagenome]